MRETACSPTVPAASDSANPGYADPGTQRFELQADSPPAGAGLPLSGITGTAGADLGAFARGKPAWDAGHDFARPPQPEPAWVRVSDGAESVRIGVRDAGGSEHGAETSSVEWTRLVVEFTTGPDQRAATVFLKKTTPGQGYAWCDNVGLPRVSRSRTD